VTKKKRTRGSREAKPQKLEDETRKSDKRGEPAAEAKPRKADKAAKTERAAKAAGAKVEKKRAKTEPRDESEPPRSARTSSKPKRQKGAKPSDPIRLAEEAKTIPGVELEGELDAPLDVLLEENEDPLVEEAPELGIGSRMVPPHVSWSDPLDSMPPSSSPHGDVAEQIRALEARLDGLIRNGALAATDRGNGAETASVAIDAAASQAVDQAVPEDIAQSPFFEKQWGRESLRNRSEEVDDFGLDPAYEQRFRPLAEFLYRRYFRVKTEGIANVPASGRAIVVANHSGTLPLDGLILRSAFRLEHPAARELRWLAEDFLFYLPFAGVFMNRVGAIRACQENAERLLAKENLVAVFPEGVQGIRKLFRERYRLQRFGRGGYIRLALRMRAPLVPCAIVGAEETNPLLYRVEYLANLLGLPYIPVTPTFPLLGPLGLVPAPSRWRIEFGEPISLDNYGPESAEDHVLVGRLSERVRATIQGMLDKGVRERRSIWFG
jgi:1-acyl-sn-glycerol-3-phosphate acyltransferase